MEVQRMENNLEIDLLYERLVEIEDNEYLHNKIVNESKKEINLIYSEIEQEYLDFVKNSKYSCSLYCIAQCINLSLIERENGLGKYLLIQSYKYNNLFGGNGNLYWRIFLTSLGHSHDMRICIALQQRALKHPCRKAICRQIHSVSKGLQNSPIV